MTSLGDPTSATHVAVVSVAAALLAFPNPANRGVAGRLGLRVGGAALSGLVAWAALRELQDDFFRRPLRAGFTAAAVGSALAVAEASDALDARLHRGLVRRGVGHPRLVLALASGATTALSFLPGRKDDASLVPDSEEPEEEVTVAVPAEVRALTEALLAASDQWGAQHLRAQLAAAKAIQYIGEAEEAFYPGIGFSVPADLPRAVPHNTRFSVVGRYYPLNGRSADVTLTISDGRIDSLSIGTGDDWTIDEEIAWMDEGGSVQDISQWPAPHELTFFVETEHGLRPLERPSAEDA
jgi:hypothetical protein